MIESIIQGILEAFPISSSLHLSLLNIENIELLHLGTGIAFFAFAISYLEPYFKKPFSLKTMKFAIKILILILPTGIIGFYFKKQIKFADPYLINLVFAILMLYANQFEKTKNFNNLKLSELIIISLIISSALMPGTSRLGVTFTAFRLFKLTIEEAFINSIIIGIPITTAAAIININNNIITLTLIFSFFFGAYLTYQTLKITKQYLKYWNIYAIYRIIFSLIQIYKR